MSSDAGAPAQARDTWDPRRPAGHTGVLGAAAAVGVLDASDVHVAHRLSVLCAEQDAQVALALALTVRAVRLGSVCLDLADAVALAPTPDADADADATGVGQWWPTDAQTWLAAVETSSLVAAGVLRVEFGVLYLERYHAREEQVAGVLRARLSQPPPELPSVDELDRTLSRLFPGDGWDEQRRAARRAATQWTTVLTGGPGTGKTTTVAGLLVAMAQQADLSGDPMRIALAAPTGKAAARLQESVAQAAQGFGAADSARITGLQASTIHRLLGWNPRQRGSFRYDGHNRLPYEVVVVDETSMVDLDLMSSLLSAVRPGCRLLLVGDSDQLASVNAGAVLADLVEGYESLEVPVVVRLRVSRRFEESIGALASAIRAGDEDATLGALRSAPDAVRWIEQEDPREALRPILLEQALQLRSHAVDGDTSQALAVLAQQRLLCGRRTGPRGVNGWNVLVQQWLSEATGDPLWERMYPGRPLLVTRNDYGLDLRNGDSGVVVASGEGPVAALTTAGGTREMSAGRLSEVETMYAMTVHKAQGSEADRIIVLLPDDESPMLVRELLYTAVTRARRHVTVVGSEAAVRRAVQQRIRRATGLRQRMARE